MDESVKVTQKDLALQKSRLSMFRKLPDFHGKKDLVKRQTRRVKDIEKALKTNKGDVEE